VQVEAEHITDWMSEHGAVVAGPEKAAELVAVVEALPWMALSLDKEAIGGVMTRDDAPDFEDQVRQARLGRHSHVYVMYAGDELGLIAPLADVLADLDLLYSGAPGYQYLCGASADLRLSPDDLAEYEADYGAVWLRS